MLLINTQQVLFNELLLSEFSINHTLFLVGRTFSDKNSYIINTFFRENSNISCYVVL